LTRNARVRAALAAAILVPSATAAGQARPADAATAQVRTWREQHEPAIVGELNALLAIPNNASDSVNIRRNAALLVQMFEKRGAAARLLENGAAPPAVFAEIRSPGATRTIVFYAHYDGQPVAQAEWATPAWQPVLRAKPGADGSFGAVKQGPTSGRYDPEDRIYARSASDDKSPIIAMLAALDAMRATGQKASVNLKFFLEGEEEAGSTHLKPLLERYKTLLAADAWMFCDGPVHQSRQMQVLFGVRGVMGVGLTVYGPSRALHSGHYGNWAPNPGMLLTELVASLRDVDGRILIDHFMDDVVPPTPTELAAARAVPPVDEELRRSLLINRTEANNAPLVERIMLPALNLRGIKVGQVGAAANNAVPTEAEASIDFRLVPNQTPEKIRSLLEAHLTARGWYVVHNAPTAAERLAHPKVVRLTAEGGYPAYRTSMDQPVAKAVRQVVSQVIGRDVIALPTLGGSVGMSEFYDVLQVPLITLPIVNHDNNQHAKDENIRLQNLWDGIEVFAGVMTRLGNNWSTVVP
jgi:acetylornithine deacetylase/succinyl-diaminopimelate desuccinylase-like protein